jgi:PAS domain S-box-containing protein
MKDKHINILLIEDDRPDADIVREMLAEADGDKFTVEHASTLSNGLDRLTDEDIDVILLDLLLPDSHGLETLTSVQTQAPHLPIIVLSGAMSKKIAIQAVQEGAQDYLTKGQVDSSLLTRAIHYAIERKQIEKSLRASKKKYQALYNSIRDAILVADTDRRITDCNPAFTDLFGYTLDEIKGKKTSYIYENEEQFEKLGRALKRHGDDSRLISTVNYQKKSGEIFPGSTNVFYLRDQEGNIQGFIGLIRDTSEQKQAEEKAIQQKEFLENVLESLTHPFYVVNIDDYTIEIANSAAIPPEKSAEDPTCYGITHNAQVPCSGENHPCPLNKVKTSGAPVKMEHIHHTSGGHHHVEVYGYPVFDETGNISQMIEYTLDITERKHAERALRRERDLVARLMDTSPVSITMVNREGEITFANARAEEILGLSKKELMGRTYHAPEWHITDFDGEPFAEEDLPFRQVLRTGEPVYDVRHAIEWPNGRRVLLSVNGAPLLDEEGRVERVVFAIEDVTKQVQAERKRIEQFKQEIHAIEQIAALPNTVISARSFGAAPLSEKVPDVFNSLVESYKNLLDKALERKVYKIEDTMSEDTRILANRLGTLNARPRDVIDVHITALKEQSERSNALKSEAYAEEGRLITLELMGHLVSYYRNRCDTTPRSPRDVKE